MSVLQRCHTLFVGLGELDAVAICVHMLQENSTAKGQKRSCGVPFGVSMSQTLRALPPLTVALSTLTSKYAPMCRTSLPVATL